MARGDISLCKENNEKLPPMTALDSGGCPTSDPVEAIAGVQLAFGGAKGSNIALLVELLASMSGSPFSFEQHNTDTDSTSSTPTLAGQFIVAVDPAHFKPEDESMDAFNARYTRLFTKILDSDAARLPSTARPRARKLSETCGYVEVPTSSYEIIQRVRASREWRSRGW